MARRILVIVALVCASFPLAAVASPPDNDDFAHATEITSIPFTDEIDLAAATPTSDESTSCLNGSGVWYRISRPAPVAIEIRSIADFRTVVGLWTTAADGALRPLGCRARFNFELNAGREYFLMLAADLQPFSDGSGLLGVGTARLDVTLDPSGPLPLPPINDDLDAATEISALPYEDSSNTFWGTVDAGEPVTCMRSGALERELLRAALGEGGRGSVWYRYLALDEDPVFVGTQYNGPARIGVFEITPDGLELITCGRDQDDATGGNQDHQQAVFSPQQGLTYAIQISAETDEHPVPVTVRRATSWDPAS